jgi:type VI secretion system (T6SS) phospholipase Tle1-like effector
MAYRAYRSARFHTFLRLEWFFRIARDVILFVLGQRYQQKQNTPIESIEFLGLWDTVAAYGLPVDEMARGVSQWILPLELPDRSFDLRIQRACHALSLDDERTTFHPVLWNEKDVPQEKLSQVWFSGVHSNVGGGYPDDSLAHIPLHWIMKEAQARGLNFKTAPNQPNDPDPDMMVFTEWRRDKDGRLYDSRNGMGGYYRYGPRKIEDLSHMRFSLRKSDFVDNNPPIIHETAINRARIGAHRYAPIGIPKAYTVMTDTGVRPQAAYENTTQAQNRCGAQEAVWNVVWRRRFIYFITVFASLYIVLYPLATKVDSSAEYVTPLTLVSAAIRAAGQVLPGALSVWIDAYARDPSHFLVLGLLVVGLIWLGVRLGGSIEDKMERVWRSFQPAKLAIGKVLGGLLLIAAVAYAVGHSYLPANWPAQDFLQNHISTPVSAILICTVVALYTPAGLVQHLRNAKPYRFFVRSIKLFVLPFVFAVSFYVLALLFGSHFAFSLEDSFGMVCPASKNIAEKPDAEKPDQGLEACPAATVASCHTGNPTCPDGRVVSCLDGTASCKLRTRPADECNPMKRNCEYRVPVCEVSAPAQPPNSTSTTQFSGFAICPSTCEIRPNAVDRVTKNIDNILRTNSVCKQTGIWLEQGQKYRVKITAPPPDSDNPWKDGHIKVSTRGVDVSDLSLKDRFWQVVRWPLKRHLFVEPFKVIARVGSTGNDERVLEPDDNPKSNNLEALVTPKRSGELFLYVNEAVWAYKPAWGNFYRDNSGTAIIAVSRADD